MRMANSKNSCRTALILILAAFLTGCGGALPTVEGTVTLDGQPLDKGFVSFVPVGSGTMGTATIQEGGYYAVKTGGQGGLTTGEYRVAITAYSTRPGRNEMEAPQFALATPAKYNDPQSSGFTVEVTPGQNTFDFALDSSEP